MGFHYRTFGADAQENGGIRRVASIRAGFAADFAAVLGCETERVINAVESGRVEPFTSIGDPTTPEKFALSFLPDDFQQLKELLT